MVSEPCGPHGCTINPGLPIAPGFKDKTRYTPYVCPGTQFTHIVTNERVKSKTMPLLHST